MGALPVAALVTVTVSVSTLAALLFAQYGLCTALLGLGRRRSPLIRRLLPVMLVKSTGLGPKLEKRHFSFCAFTEP